MLKETHAGFEDDDEDEDGLGVGLRVGLLVGNAGFRVGDRVGFLVGGEVVAVTWMMGRASSNMNLSSSIVKPCDSFVALLSK